MKPRITLTLLTALLCFTVRAETPTLSPVYTDRTFDASNAPGLSSAPYGGLYHELQGLADTLPAKRNNIFRRIGNYFADSNVDKTPYKKFDFSIIGGPHYSSNVKLGLGVVAAGLYRIDRNDLTIPPSNISLFGDIATSGFFLIGISGNTYFQGAKYRVDYSTSYYAIPTDFWGVGYLNGLNNRSINYKRVQFRFNADFMYRFAPNWYAGLNAMVYYTKGKDLEQHRDYLPVGAHTEYTSVGIGPFIVYDSRDVVTNAHRGLYFKMSSTFFPTAFGNRRYFNRTELTLDYYHRVWKGGILAYDMHGEINTAGVPWTMMALLGGFKRMRGYYEGRFRDKGIMEVQAELRQKVWRRIGVTVWGGAGNVFPSFSDIKASQTLPNVGVGFRWEFKNRVNVRLDYGFGKKSSGFIFNINEAF